MSDTDRVISVPRNDEERAGQRETVSIAMMPRDRLVSYFLKAVEGPCDGRQLMRRADGALLAARELLRLSIRERHTCGARAESFYSPPLRCRRHRARASANRPLQ